MRKKLKIIALSGNAIVLLVLIVLSYIFLLGAKVEDVIVEINNGEAVFIETDGFLVPGESLRKTLIIKNPTNTPVKYQIYIDNIIGFIDDALIINLFSRDRLEIRSPMLDLTFDQSYSPENELMPGEEHNYYIVIEVLDKAGNEYIGEELIFDIVINLINQ